MEIKAYPNPRVSLTLDGHAEVTFVCSRSVLSSLEALKDKDLLLKVTSYSPRRSLSQNAYMWMLLGELSIKLKISKEEIYRGYIQDYGTYEILPVRNDAVKRFEEAWQFNGVGWLCKDMGESKLDGYTKLMVYYGSSSYNSHEMRALLDAIVNDCNEQGIDTMPLKDIMLLKNDNDAK